MLQIKALFFAESQRTGRSLLVLACKIGFVPQAYKGIVKSSDSQVRPKFAR